MGAFGLVRPGGLDLGLTIRTVAAADGQVHLWAGGGITWGSDPRRRGGRGARQGGPGAAGAGGPSPASVGTGSGQHRPRPAGGADRGPARPAARRGRLGRGADPAARARPPTSTSATPTTSATRSRWCGWWPAVVPGRGAPPGADPRQGPRAPGRQPQRRQPHARHPRPHPGLHLVLRRRAALLPARAQPRRAAPARRDAAQVRDRRREPGERPPGAVDRRGAARLPRRRPRGVPAVAGSGTPSTSAGARASCAWRCARACRSCPSSPSGGRRRRCSCRGGSGWPGSCGSTASRVSRPSRSPSRCRGGSTSVTSPCTSRCRPRSPSRRWTRSTCGSGTATTPTSTRSTTTSSPSCRRRWTGSPPSGRLPVLG